jgi:hypothetical protein
MLHEILLILLEFLNVETVCRAITDLQHRGVIALAGKRTVKILNRGALEDRAGADGAQSNRGLAFLSVGG